MALELLQLYTVLRCHPTLRRCRFQLQLCVHSFNASEGREWVLTETGRRDYVGWPKWATSLNERRMGPLSVMAMREIDATATNVRQARPSPASRTQATAALMGDTWLTTTMSASAAAG